MNFERKLLFILYFLVLIKTGKGLNNHGQSLPTLSLHAAKSKMFIMCIKAISSFMLCSFGISIEASAPAVLSL